MPLTNYIVVGLCLSTLPQRVLSTHMRGWLLLLLKTSKLKSFVRPWFHGCNYHTNQIKKLYSHKYCYMLCSFLHTMSKRVAGKGVSNPKAEYIKSKDAYILSYYGFGFRWICAIDYRNFHITPYDTQINNAAFVAFEKNIYNDMVIFQLFNFDTQPRESDFKSEEQVEGNWEKVKMKL